MSRTHNRRYDDDDTMRDGERRRFSMYTMDDDVQRAIRLTKQKLADDAGTEVCDALGGSGAALRRPGYRCLTGDAAVTAQQELARARQQYLDDLTSAWQGDQRKGKNDDEDDDDITGGNQEGAKARGKRKAQYRDPQGREAGTEEEFEDHMRRAQADRRRATDEVYARAEQEARDAYKNWK